ncbi:MAG: LysM peptidoglycan-binding domain-containing protein [Gemmatimonadaceae bacterium]
MPRLRLTLATVLIGLAFTPSLGVAQGEVRTHTVRPGDTLWDLAAQYLGDAFRWPEIYRRNTETVADPHWIYPDQVLIISGEVQPTPGTPPDEPRPMPEPLDTMAPEPLDPMALEPELPPPAMTIFNPNRFRVVRGQRESLLVRPRAAAVRAGDYLRAPFLWDINGVAGAGRLDGTTEQDGVGITLTKRPIQIYERVYIVTPEGAEGGPEERYLLFRYGPVVPGSGRVVIPTGVVKLVTASINGRALGVVLTKFEDVYAGDLTMPLDTLSLEPGIFPTHVEFGLQTSVVYLYRDPVLAPIGHQLIFAAGAGDGLVPGDQLTLQREKGRDDTGAPLPPEDIAVAQVTRVTPWGASAILIGQSDGGVARGISARVTAKMP